uniref:Uncharacterized protein n=1 Tax=Rheinheimera sp. BAL341 TaxID=1708203 RepID=A0A486XRV1_9GAMM
MGFTLTALAAALTDSTAEVYYNARHMLGIFFRCETTL